MNFNSLEYIIFLPIVFAIYWIIPNKFRWPLLLVASYYFYMSWNPKYVVLILFTTVISYVAAILLVRYKTKKIKKFVIAITLIVCLGVLFFFKYFNFVSVTISNIVNRFAIEIHPVTLNLLLPVGISFYTFQTLSYVIDVYRGEVEPEYNFGIYATFISFFPQLVAGPIERTKNLLPQIKSEKKFDYDLAMYGSRQMLWGFFKKIVVADLVAVYVDKVYNNLYLYSGLDLLIVIFFFTIQIYCDFSGYSDIAIGTAKLFGINLTQNFFCPYFATSIKEFWSRWHISLSTWFRDYVYIPIGGNRCSKIKNAFNLILTFMVSGLWHGANWNFVIWGGIHGIAQVAEKLLKINTEKQGKLKKFISGIIVFIFCNLAWVFFRTEKFSDAIYVLTHFTKGVLEFNTYWQSSLGITFFEGLFIFIAIFIVALWDYFALKQDNIKWLTNRRVFLHLIIEYALLLCIFIALVINSGESQFVYFQF